MRKSFLMATAMSAAMAFSCASIAQAQEADVADDSAIEVEEVVVTGSFISRSAETTALPVDVISAEEIEKKGSPTVTEQIKSLTVSSGVLGESNQFGSGSGAYGVATVNLRGLGAARTLVLLNGKRIANNDLNTLPSAAVGRIEVLKEGAATAYGSDAIGGVFNFITRKPFTGLELGANYRYVDGSDGDYGASVLAGWEGETTSLLFSFGYQHRSDLAITERDWALRPFYENPEGGWTGATNPSRFIPVAGFTYLGASRNDVGCAALGGTTTADGICRQQYLPWDNIVDKEDRGQVYAEFNADLTDSLTFHVEAMYAKTDVEGVNTSPSFATSRGPSVNALPVGFPNALTRSSSDDPRVSNFFYVPTTNPGFAAYCAANPAACPVGTTGALFTVGTYRPFLAGGNPLFADGAPGIENVREQTRLSGGFKGTVGEFGLFGIVDFAANLTYSQYDNKRDEYDTVANRLQLAMRGLGGPNCDYANGTPGADGCLYFNPFSNAVSSNFLTGQANPGYNPAVANSNEVIGWFYQRADQARASDRLFEGNLVFNGESELELPGGAIAYAVGAQWRREGLISNPAAQSSRQINGCTDSLTPDIQTSSLCTPQLGPFVFLGQINEFDDSRNIYAAFAEFELPLTETLDLTIAGRYEDYGDRGGDTANPKVSLRWQAHDALAFRASYSTTFRAPSLTQLSPNTGIGLRNVFGSFRGIATTGNPNLKPETADTYSVGAIFNSDGLKVSLDYYNYKMEEVLGSEVLETVLSNIFQGGTTCSTAVVDQAYIDSHLDYAGDCTTANITQVNLLGINQGVIETDGYDFLADYRIPTTVWDADLAIGGSASYVNSYTVNGVEAAGFANSFGTGIAVPMPRVKAELYAEANRGPHNLRVSLRHIGTYDDNRASVFTPTNANTQTSPAITAAQAAALTYMGREIKAQNQVDLTYRVQLPSDTTLAVAVQNVFDKAPPFARTELSYDPLTGNPLGRTIQINVKKAF